MTEPTTPRGKQPVEFTWKGVTYVADLDADEAAELDASMVPFVATARRLEMDPALWA
jgi:hypothetical protein